MGAKAQDTTTYPVKTVDQLYNIIVLHDLYPLLILFPTEYGIELVGKLARWVEFKELPQGIERRHCIKRSRELLLTRRSTECTLSMKRRIRVDYLPRHTRRILCPGVLSGSHLKREWPHARGQLYRPRGAGSRNQTGVD